MTKSVIIFIIIQLLLLIPSFFWYKKVIKKYNPKSTNLLSVTLTLIMPIIYTTIFIFIHFFIINPIIRSKNFEQKEWVEDIHSRYRMANDISNSNLLTGKTKKEVIEILGKDFKENCWIKNTLCYTAPDPDNYSFLDHYVFVVYFDKKGIVKRVGYELI